MQAGVRRVRCRKNCGRSSTARALCQQYRYSLRRRPGFDRSGDGFFALTSLDSGTRLLRYNIAEIAESAGIPKLGNRYVASVIAVTLIGFFAFYELQGLPAGLALWGLFGSTNQVLGALTLLTITIYLRQQRSNYWYTFVPMVFMLVVTISAMTIDLTKYWSGGQTLLFLVALSIFILSIWLVVEAYLRFRKDEGDSGMISAAVDGD